MAPIHDIRAVVPTIRAGSRQLATFAATSMSISAVTKPFHQVRGIFISTTATSTATTMAIVGCITDETCSNSSTVQEADFPWYLPIVLVSASVPICGLIILLFLCCVERLKPLAKRLEMLRCFQHKHRAAPGYHVWQSRHNGTVCDTASDGAKNDANTNMGRDINNNVKPPPISVLCSTLTPHKALQSRSGLGNKSETSKACRSVRQNDRPRRSLGITQRANRQRQQVVEGSVMPPPPAVLRHAGRFMEQPPEYAELCINKYQARDNQSYIPS